MWEFPCCYGYLELEGRCRNLSFNLCLAIFSGSTDCALAGITLLLAERGVEEGVPMAVPGRRGRAERVLLGVGMRLLDVDLNSSVCVCVCLCGCLCVCVCVYARPKLINPLSITLLFSLFLLSSFLPLLFPAVSLLFTPPPPFSSSLFPCLSASSPIPPSYPSSPPSLQLLPLCPPAPSSIPPLLPILSPSPPPPPPASLSNSSLLPGFPLALMSGVEAEMLRFPFNPCGEEGTRDLVLG